MIEVLLQAESALSLGLLDRAEILYRQVVIADPRNSIAVVGLARVALERGDEPGALHQARRALGIDPQNAAASRMVERLEEILRYRGVATTAPAETVKAGAPPPAETPLPTETPPAAETPLPATPATPATPVAPPASALEPVDHQRSIIDRLLRRR